LYSLMRRAFERDSTGSILIPWFSMLFSLVGCLLQIPRAKNKYYRDHRHNEWRKLNQ
jgi:hypothetical protein